MQDRIVNKLNLLTQRVLNDINFSSKIIFQSSVTNNSSKNEIDVLSVTFNKYIKYVQFLQHEIEKSSQLAAVGHIAHSIAHDLRKPFSNTLLFVKQIEKIQSVDEVILLSQDYKTVLQNSIVYVEHLLKEIMEAGVSRLNILNTVKLEEIILKSLANMTHLPDYCNVELDYKIDIKHNLQVDELRIIRVFSNLISNALEAMNFQGKIYFSATENVNRKFVEIILGNTNSFIDPLEMKYLFEPFYTNNKKNGTGLGLSIAQKIIQLHGGTIYCRSDKSKGVEFIFTLPLSDKKDTCDHLMLPRTFMSSNSPFLARVQQGIPSKNEEHCDEENDGINKTPDDMGGLQKDKIILVDDDPFVGRSWKRMVKDAEVKSFLCPEDFLNKIRNEPHQIDENTVIITDFNFGKNSRIDFYNFILKLRVLFFGIIFLSTDALDEDLNFDFLNEHKVIKINKTIYLFSELKAKYINKI